jgi:hypothetical protein
MRAPRRFVGLLAILPLLGCSKKAVVPSGGYYYKTAQASCAYLAAEDSGTLFYPGFCTAGQFERTRSRAVALVCRGHNGTEQTVVYDVTTESGVVHLGSGGRSILDLFRAQADCERAITSDDRAAAKKAAAEAAEQRRKAEAEAAEKSRKSQAEAAEQRRDQIRRREVEVARERRVRAARCCACLDEAKSHTGRCLTIGIEGCSERLLVGSQSMTQQYCLWVPCGSACKGFK